MGCIPLVEIKNKEQAFFFYIYIYIYIYPGGLRPDRRAPGDFAEEGAFQNMLLLRFVYVF